MKNLVNLYSLLQVNFKITTNNNKLLQHINNLANGKPQKYAIKKKISNVNVEKDAKLKLNKLIMFKIVLVFVLKKDYV